MFHPGLREYVPIYSRVFLGMFLAAGLARYFGSCVHDPIDLWPFFAAAICPVFYFAFAMRSHLDMGIRHILPIYPYLFILIGVAAARVRTIWPRAGTAFIAIFILGLATETLSAYPDFIPFFNIAAGGSRGGLHLLGNSDIDWGQELTTLREWQTSHPDRQLNLSYFGFPDPGYYGIRYQKFPDDMIKAHHGAPKATAFDVFAINAAMLQGNGAVDPSQSAYLSRSAKWSLLKSWADQFIYSIPHRRGSSRSKDRHDTNIPPICGNRMLRHYSLLLRSHRAWRGGTNRSHSMSLCISSVPWHRPMMRITTLIQKTRRCGSITRWLE